MSCFNSIRQSTLPRPYHLLTVFSQSCYVDRSVTGLAGRDAVTAVRVAEDLTFARRYGLQYHDGGLEDCLLRHGRVCFDPEASQDAALVAVVQSLLQTLISTCRLETVVVQRPFGDTQHCDHRIVWEAALLLARAGWKVSFFYTDDIPYSVVTGEKPCRNLKFDHEDLLLKHEAMGLYASQMSGYFHDRVDLLALETHFTERLFSFSDAL